MNSSYLIGGVALIAGVAAVLVMESKIIGLVLSGVAALFLVITGLQDFSANKNASRSDFRAEKAEFNLDFARAEVAIGKNISKEKMAELEKGAVKLRAEADAAEEERASVQKKTEATRKPLLDAVTNQVNDASKPEDDDSSMTSK